MRILLIVPDAKAPGGNVVTGRRWAAIFRALGHVPTTAPSWRPGSWDLVVALHAWKSRRAIREATAAGIPVVVALTGTDLYRDLRRRAAARRSLDLASAIVALQPEASRDLKPAWRRKTHVIFQSVPAAGGRRESDPATFDVCVLGHLRAVKDPLLAARASRALPADSRVRVVQIGAALQPGLERRAAAEGRRNPRYQWLDQRSRDWTLRRLRA